MSFNLEYFYEIYCTLPRAGPGDNSSTKKAYQMMKELPQQPKILDIGCGPGMQTFELAKLSQGKILALDNYQPFLDAIKKKAAKLKLKNISTINQSMMEMNFAPKSFDLIWSEGALYIMGFETGLKQCHELLKDKGYVAVSELVWLKPDPPQEIKEAHQAEYPPMTSIDENLKKIEHCGFKNIGHFTLPNSSWTDNYYGPMAKKIKQLKKKYAKNNEALQAIDLAEIEIYLFDTYSAYFGYEFYIMQKA